MTVGRPTQPTVWALLYHAQVRLWQERQREQAMTLGYVETMLGRRRQLPGAQDRNDRSARKGHALRAAINTPIQVSGTNRLFEACLWPVLCVAF